MAVTDEVYSECDPMSACAEDDILTKLPSDLSRYNFGLIFEMT